MATAGYSGTSLFKKLGIKGNTRVHLVNSPPDYFQLLGYNIEAQIVNFDGSPDLVHLFVTSNKEFEREMKKLEPLYKAQRSMVIWVSWYKKTSGLNTDLTEDTIRAYALANDLVDIKVCAVSDSWSGLKLVVPKSKR